LNRVEPNVAETTVPIANGERITNLDSVRGFATLGILVMNAVSFGLPEAAYFNLAAAGSVRALDWLIGILGEIFVDQKTMALFSLLFGAGIVVFADRAAAKGRRAVRLSLWRNLLLLGIGLLHSLLWDGDILVVYALCSPVLLAVRRCGARGLMITGAALVVSSAAWAVLAQAQIPAGGDGLGSYWFVDGGPIGDTAGLFLVGDFFLRSLGMMLIGVALYRLGIVQGTRPPAYYRRMMCLGFGVGFPLAAAGVVCQVALDFSPDIALLGAAPNTLATIPIAMGYLGLIALWNQQPTTVLHERVRAVGRMALTNYLTQTLLGIVVLSTVFDSGEATRSGITVFILSVWLAQLLWSKAWLARFRLGPFEWAWRCATYGRFQMIRRS
jgi:uncharacterized protein